MINKALEVAEKCVDFRQRIGCVITDKRGRVISTAFNIKKTHPLQAKHSNIHKLNKIYLHAEIAALVKCRHVPHTLYVARLSKGNNVGLAKPCKICMGAIIEAGVKRIVYTDNDGNTNEINL